MAAMEEDAMKRFAMILLAGTLGVPTAAMAHDTETAFPTRGACESASAAMSSDENSWLLATFPGLFDTTGEAASFLTKAFTCDRNPSDGQYYVTGQIEEVLGSEWYQRRNH
jgi:hypothetical protein